MYYGALRFGSTNLVFCQVWATLAKISCSRPIDVAEFMYKLENKSQNEIISIVHAIVAVTQGMFEAFQWS